ncbi:hypothetical protein B0J13DRAFT_545757 [Dactylonectria estremocensis]|uniref:Uncharacterized protein n=1 Tax=Dactylonectria estremocensis TaxID=1079267 RepID=A0A9P9J9B6_9HYPO|nr:hypothetical protein B0J13DRAFT_545757 [Dactylonectria estremocensis]
MRFVGLRARIRLNSLVVLSWEGVRLSTVRDLDSLHPTINCEQGHCIWSMSFGLCCTRLGWQSEEWPGWSIGRAFVVLTAVRRLVVLSIQQRPVDQSTNVRRVRM